MNDVKLLPCQFCGGEPEMDTRQAFRAITSGVMESAVAIYCTACTCQMMHCYSDHPGVAQEDLWADLIAAWNRRPAIDRKTQWGRVDLALGADGDCVDDVFAKAAGVARLVEADKEYDAAGEAWDALDTRSIGDFGDPRDYDGPEYERLLRAIERRKEALAPFTSAQQEVQS